MASPPNRDRVGRLVVPTTNRRKEEKKIVKSACRKSKSDVQALMQVLMEKIKAMGAETETRLNEMLENMKKMVPLEEERRVRFAKEINGGKDEQDQILEDLKTLRGEIARVSALQDEGNEDE